MKALALALCVLSTSAFADGANLTYLPAPALSPAEQQTMATIQAHPTVTSAVANGMTASALDSTIVNVTIAGAVYRLVGAKTNSAEDPNIDEWRGTGMGATGYFARSNGVVRGRVQIGPKRYGVVQIGTWVGVTTLLKQQQVID